MTATIILDAGHGGFDNGATYMGRAEKDDTLRLTLAIGEKLQQDGYDVYYTRTSDVYQTPHEKAELANQSGGQYLISFHRNYGIEDNLYNGIQTIFHEENETVKHLAENIHQQLEKTGFKNLGTAEIADLILLREAAMPSVLLEVGFLNSDIDNQLFDDKFNEIVQTIATGIEESIPITAQSVPPRYFVQTGLFRYDVNAAYQLERLQMQGFSGQIHYEKPYYGVWSGGFHSLDQAVDLQNELKKNGYTTLIVSTGE